ncbi:MAG TPA: PilX N-terminal domain-containing pilus assembly protein [Gammaproteobacteria bacterium]|nr:PilX N-terminal domain-containing pilus assembly protein [Gammaproteobacteria bacterium]
MAARRKQTGATLVVALMMLVVLALLGVTAVNNSMVNLRIVGNMQAHQDAEAVSQEAIEQVISSIAIFNNPQPSNITLAGVTVQVSEPACLDVRPAEGYSATFPLAPEDTHWEIGASYDDPVSGAQAQLVQGVTIVMPAGSCP